jgi:hypothetical protein
MATDIDERPTIEERHLAAANTSDMTLDPNRRGQADVILAAGLAARGNQLGHALMHLQAEWDRCDKPPKRSAAWIAARAAQVPDKKGRPDIRRAAIEAMVWHSGAMRQRAMALSGRSVVIGLLTDWAALRGIDPDLLSPAVFHWLAPRCPACEGLGKRPVLYGKEQSKESCNHCRGVGDWPRPLGADEIHSHIKSCLGKVRGGMSGALYG